MYRRPLPAEISGERGDFFLRGEERLYTGHFRHSLKNVKRLAQ